jgi:hypothetical protein
MKKKISSIFLALILLTTAVNACVPAPTPAPHTSTFTPTPTSIPPEIAPTVDPLSGQMIHDPNQHVYWLADANLAGNSTIRSQLGVKGINPNGTMDYQTALKWVDALNAYDNGRGYLGHHNW